MAALRHNNPISSSSRRRGGGGGGGGLVVQQQTRCSVLLLRSSASLCFTRALVVAFCVLHILGNFSLAVHAFPPVALRHQNKNKNNDQTMRRSMTTSRNAGMQLMTRRRQTGQISYLQLRRGATICEMNHRISSLSDQTWFRRSLSTKVSPLRAVGETLVQEGQEQSNVTEIPYFSAGAGTASTISRSTPTVVVVDKTSLSSTALDHLEDEIETPKEDNLFEGLRSRPKEGGNWNPHAPLKWAADFGRRSEEYEQRLMQLTKLGPGDEGYFDVSDITVPKVTIVRTKEQARIVMDRLMNADTSIFHACDTEVMDIDLKEVGPVGNGYVTCVSIHSGANFDYGLGDGPGTTLWIDNLDDAHGVLQEFKEWFEDERFLKVWHNYGFDRHVMWNEGINCKGFGGDTMHMARLQDTSRSKNGSGYSLEALTGEMLSMRKRPMKEIFGVPRIKKDGTPGNILDVPPVEVLQRNPRFRKNFIIYSCYDAVGTHGLHQHLTELLKEATWVSEDTNLYDYYFNNMRQFGEVLTDMERRGIRVDAKDYLASVELQARKDREEHSKKFREWAAKEIGIDGLALNPASSLQLCTFLFGGSQNLKTRQPTESEKVFKISRDEIPADALEVFDSRNEQQSNAEKKKGGVMSDELDQMKVAQLKDLCKANGLKVSGKKSDLQERLREYFLSTPPQDPAHDGFDDMTDDELRLSLIGRNLDERGERDELIKLLRDDIQYMRELENAVPLDVPRHMSISEALEAAAQKGGAAQEILAEIREKANEVPKNLEITIRSLGMKPEKYTAGGAPSVTADVLRGLAGDPFENPPRYGTAYDFFGGGDRGHEACVALYSLCSIGSIGTAPPPGTCTMIVYGRIDFYSLNSHTFFACRLLMQIQ